MVVNFNYRVGPYGFLASREVLKGGSINNGLKDQRKALGEHSDLGIQGQTVLTSDRMGPTVYQQGG